MPDKLLPPNIATFWANRRKLAFMAFGGVMGIGFGALLVEVTEAQSSLLQAVVYSLSAIVMSYIAGATWDDIEARKAMKP